MSSPAFDLPAINTRLASASAEEITAFAVETFGDGLILSTSFGAQAAVMLRLVTLVKPDVPVVFVDTGYLFPETYKFADELTKRLGLNLKVYTPSVSCARLEATEGKVWEQGEAGHKRYNAIFKVEPMQRALKELQATAWLAGLRAGQTDHRAQLQAVDQQDGLYKVHPILRWTTKQVHEYLKFHGLPYHPLYDLGYKSIGDMHSTRAISAGEDERAGRFGGLAQECGLHLPKTEIENASAGSAGL